MTRTSFSSTHQIDFYQRYIGHYAKRFYSKFEKKSMFLILDVRIRNGYLDLLYFDGNDEWWADGEDSVIITNEEFTGEVELNAGDSRNIHGIANVKSPQYKGYNPFLQEDRDIKINEIIK